MFDISLAILGVMQYYLLAGIFLSIVEVTICEFLIEKIFNLILVFVMIAFLLILYGFEFISLVILLIYVGAIAILFLFIVIVINPDYIAIAEFNTFVYND
jgi:NADH-quinone oxidoreductase subunit J